MANFDEIALRDEFISVIRKGFADKFNLLKTNVIVDTSEKQHPTFPSCFVNILNPLSDRRYEDTEGTFNTISLSLQCELFTNELKDFTLDDSIIKLSQILIEIITTNYSNLVITRNTSVPFRTDIKRRVINFSFVYDAINNMIYSN